MAISDGSLVPRAEAAPLPAAVLAGWLACAGCGEGAAAVADAFAFSRGAGSGRAFGRTVATGASCATGGWSGCAEDMSDSGRSGAGGNARAGRSGAAGRICGTGIGTGMGGASAMGGATGGKAAGTS